MPFPTPLLSLGFILSLILYLFLSAVQGNEEWRLESIHGNFWHCFLVSIFSCSNMGPSRSSNSSNRMLYLQSHPQGHNSCQQISSSMDKSPPQPHRSSQKPAPGLPSGHSLAPQWCPPVAAGGYLLPHGNSWAGLWGGHCWTLSFTTDCRGISALRRLQPPPSPSSL